jgi:hypothetical protein
MLQFDPLKDPRVQELIRANPQFLRNPFFKKILKGVWQDILLYYRRRYIALSSSKGKGVWPDIKQATKDKKKRAGLPPRILRGTVDITGIATTDTILNSLELKQISPNGYAVGIFNRSAHPGSKLTVHQLATIHQRGEGVVPIRTIMVPPPRVVKEKAIRKVSDVLIFLRIIFER